MLVPGFGKLVVKHQGQSQLWRIVSIAACCGVSSSISLAPLRLAHDACHCWLHLVHLNFHSFPREFLRHGQLVLLVRSLSDSITGDVSMTCTISIRSDSVFIRFSSGGTKGGKDL